MKNLLDKLVFILKINVSEQVKTNDALPTDQQSGKSSTEGGYSSLMKLPEGQSWGTITRKKMSNGQEAIFAIPDQLTQQDIDKLKALLKGIDGSLDGYKKDDEN